MTIRTAPTGTRFLNEIISTIGSSLELGRVLESVVRLLSDASAVHACFVYLLERDRLVLRAASDPYAHLAGKVVLERGEGLAWWVAERREPAFIRDHAAEDPRFKYVPELEEERFQSLVSVPIPARDGNAIGVISLHSEAPREFTDAEVEFLVSSATLVAGAIENARLYEESRRRVKELEHLTALGEELARAESVGELAPAVAARARELLRAESAQLYLIAPRTEELRLSASTSPGARQSISLAELGPELATSGRRASVAVPLVAGDELLGLLTADGTSEIDLARAVANQTAVTIKKIELIERLTEKNAIKDFFEQLVRGGSGATIDERAARLGCDLGGRHLVLAVAPADDAFEQAVAKLGPGSLFDRSDDGMRGLVRVPAAGEQTLISALRQAQAELPNQVAVGVSNECSGAASFAAGFQEARHALLGQSVLQSTPGVMTYEELGPYKYLLRMSFDAGLRDAHRDAIARIAQYDDDRQTSLLSTLEEFLRKRGNISATAQALYVHPNTLRQRLRRIMELSGLDLRRDDWLMVEIALKMVKLEQALGGTAADDTSSAKSV
jgi:GAF domain-containing protein